LGLRERKQQVDEEMYAIKGFILSLFDRYYYSYQNKWGELGEKQLTWKNWKKSYKSLVRKSEGKRPLL
jgi:hypothetical protein